MFFLIFLCFYACFKCRVFVTAITKTYRITNMTHFSWAKTPSPFPGPSECFVAVIIDFI